MTNAEKLKFLKKFLEEVFPDGSLGEDSDTVDGTDRVTWDKASVFRQRLIEIAEGTINST